jgi:hypothetical protein
MLSKQKRKKIYNKKQNKFKLFISTFRSTSDHYQEKQSKLKR